jgi:hypothetical protein
MTVSSQKVTCPKVGLKTSARGIQKDGHESLSEKSKVINNCVKKQDPLDFSKGTAAAKN